MRHALSLALSGALLLSAAPVLAADEAELPGVGAQAPSFGLPVYNAKAAGARMAGTMYLLGEDSEDPGAKVIVVSFMSSTCKPCMKELPLLQKLHEEKGAKGLRIIGVSIDKKEEDQKKMAEALAANKVTFPVTRDQFILTAPRFLGNQVPLPSIFVIDRQGRITFVSRGYTEETFKQVLANIDALLDPKAAQGAKP